MLHVIEQSQNVLSEINCQFSRPLRCEYNGHVEIKRKTREKKVLRALFASSSGPHWTKNARSLADQPVSKSVSQSVAHEMTCESSST
jgi:hypothetical protein